MKSKEELKTYDRVRYLANREKIIAQTKQYATEHKEQIKGYKRQYYEEHKDEIKIKHHEAYENNKNKCIQHCKEYRAKNREKCLSMGSKYQEEHWDKHLESTRKWRRNNKDKRKVIQRRYAEMYPDKVNTNTAKRRATRLHASPRWLTDEHKRQIHIMYKKAAELTKSTGTKMHVDHIIPLQGKIVCGLHVPWNLQVITAVENCRKNNKLQQEAGDGLSRT
jgi:hypothetical protein